VIFILDNKNENFNFSTNQCLFIILTIEFIAFSFHTKISTFFFMKLMWNFPLATLLIILPLSSQSINASSYHMRKYMKNLTCTILFSFSLLAHFFTSQTLTSGVDDIWIHTWANKMFSQLSFFWKVMPLIPLQMITFGLPVEGSLVPMSWSFYYVKVLNGVMFQSFHTCSPIPCKMHVQVRANN
jgi:hypothetical protein